MAWSVIGVLLCLAVVGGSAMLFSLIKDQTKG
jgi:hypothetical protein